jgi:hypothetical protein
MVLLYWKIPYLANWLLHGEFLIQLSAFCGKQAKNISPDT